MSVIINQVMRNISLYTSCQDCRMNLLLDVSDLSKYYVSLDQ